MLQQQQQRKKSHRPPQQRQTKEKTNLNPTTSSSTTTNKTPVVMDLGKLLQHVESPPLLPPLLPLPRYQRDSLSLLPSKKQLSSVEYSPKSPVLEHEAARLTLPSISELEQGLREQDQAQQTQEFPAFVLSEPAVVAPPAKKRKLDSPSAPSPKANLGLSSTQQFSIKPATRGRPPGTGRCRSCGLSGHNRLTCKFAHVRSLFFALTSQLTEKDITNSRNEG